MKRELRKVERTALRLIGARNELEQAVRAARAAGLSLRQIAATAGLSHEQVRRLSR